MYILQINTHKDQYKIYTDKDQYNFTYSFNRSKV